MFLKGYVKISKENIKNIKKIKNGNILLHTKNILPNGKNECWVIDPKSQLIDDGRFVVVKLAEVPKCRK